MELAIIALVVVLGAVVYYNRSAGRRSLDINDDGKIDAKDVVAAVETAAQGVKADVSKVAAKAVKPRSPAKKPAVKKPVARKK